MVIAVYSPDSLYTAIENARKHRFYSAFVHSFIDYFIVWVRWFSFEVTKAIINK
jgi:hypothetical protein